MFKEYFIPIKRMIVIEITYLHYLRYNLQLIQQVCEFNSLKTLKNAKICKIHFITCTIYLQ